MPSNIPIFYENYLFSILANFFKNIFMAEKPEQNKLENVHHKYDCYYQKFTKILHKLMDMFCLSKGPIKKKFGVDIYIYIFNFFSII